MTEQSDLFPEPTPARKKRGRPAPDALTPPERKRLEEWAEVNVPWLRREALESFENLDSYVEEVLAWWQGDGGLKVNWVRTIENRILVLERRRLTRMARDGHSGARAALRDAPAWAADYDARKTLTERARVFDDEDEDFAPTGGGEVVHLGDRLRGKR